MKAGTTRRDDFLRYEFFVRFSATLLFLVLTPPAFSQEVHWGVKGGIPLTDYFRTAGNSFGRGYATKINRYTVGPTLEADLPSRLGLELGILYKRQHFTGLAVSSTRGPTFPFDVYVNQKTTVDSWEVPILLKYSLSDRRTHPFVEWGASLQYLSNVRQVSTTTHLRGPTFPTTTIETTTTDKPEELERSFNVGLVMGTGVEFRVPPLRISPEFRSTLWGFRNFRSFTAATFNGLLESSQNQIEILLGISF
jgi:Outer membrane protein beta-barrel domain